MPDTPLHLHLLHPFDVISEVGGKIGTSPLEVLASGPVEPPVEHPKWNAVFQWVLDDGDDPLFFFLLEGTSTAEWVKASLAGDGVGKSPAETGNSAKSEVKWLAAIDVGSEHTNHISET